MGRTMRRAALVAAICVSPAFIHQGYAVAATLSLLSTKFTTKSNDLSLTVTPTQVFDRVPITCPSLKTCTMRIELSAQLFKVNTSVDALVSINDSAAGIVPSGEITIGGGDFPLSPTPFGGRICRPDRTPSEYDSD
jgi:hypothetical protein